jgi:phosphoenolpyruvate-protein kinase (PTS system EI component)
MPERVLNGVLAAPGVAAGVARHWDQAGSGEDPPVETGQRPQAAALALAALRAASSELDELAAWMRRDGRSGEAELIEAGAMFGGDPMLHAAVEEAVLQSGRAPAAAIAAAIEDAAGALDRLDDPMLAARAADVRSLGRRAARLARGDAVVAPPPGDADIVVIASDLGPADVAEFGAGVRALALAAGGVTGHAAIVARSIGIPMVVGLGPQLLEVHDGDPLVVDAAAGVVVASPSPDRVSRARDASARHAAVLAGISRAAGAETTTRDGHCVRILANVSSRAELDVAMRNGAAGVGLLRTELAFLDAARWPDGDEQRRALEPILAGLHGLPATVRLFDFGGDKTPPFLRGTRGRGIELLLASPDALSAQLDAIVQTAAMSELRILIPMVTSLDQVQAVRVLLDDTLQRLHIGNFPTLGAMVESPAAAAIAGLLAVEVGVLSIGTNDLASSQLGLDRNTSNGGCAHHPEVLRLIDATVSAAHRAGIVAEVCGEAASDPVMMPLLVGLGVDELSVGAARVAVVREWLAQLEYASTAKLAQLALEATSLAEVEHLTASTRGHLEPIGA